MTVKFRPTLAAYIRSRWKVPAAFGGFLLIFLCVYALYHVSLEPVLYASLLAGSVALCLGVWDFLRFFSRHRTLAALMNSIAVSLEELPVPQSLLEEDYQALLNQLTRDKAELISQADARHSEMLDYYTMWAHQIKTPIAAMGLLLQSEENPDQSQLSQELFKIEQYVEMVLQYLRLSDMSSDLLLRDYSLDDMVRQAVKKYAAVFIHKKLAIRLEPLNQTVVTDEKWLVFVIEQLLSNALKYTREGTISIYMDPHEEKTLVIEDTGIGIQPEDLPRLFEKGFTGYNGRMDKKSTGLGLYLCRGILKKLRHGISIRSTLGQGTQVRLDLARQPLEIE